MDNMIFPEPLRNGDKVAIVSPASAVRPELIDGAADTLRLMGFEPVVMPHAKGQAPGSFSGSRDERLDDFLSAWRNPSIKAVICGRGGYGCVHLLDSLSAEPLRENAKWLVGFSDISALHALLHSKGIASVHASMCKHLSEFGPDDECTLLLDRILRGAPSISYDIPPHPLNLPGDASGPLIGGNLAVLNGLASTPFDLLDASSLKGAILWLEDIAEPIYKIERVLYRLHHSGALSALSGLVFGQFTLYKPDRDHESVEQMAAECIRRWGYRFPVAFGWPSGHVDRNLPLVEGARATLSVTPGSACLRMMMEEP